ncbi:MAG: SMI1/KNR4 family protein [Bacteroidia bacterium]|nr:SMI1/KNR4 family protein [Bacteroidia bacterium]
MEMELFGLKIPEIILTKMKNNLWKSPPGDVVRNLCPGYEGFAPIFFSIDQIRFETEAFYAIAAGDENLNPWNRNVIGVIINGKFPGLIRPEKLLMIGSCGADEPIALYYLESQETPVVVYEDWTGTVPFWHQIAPNIETFLEMCGIG